MYVKCTSDEGVDDSVIEECLKDSSLLPELKDIIPLMGHRVKFIKTFKELQKIEKGRLDLTSNELSPAEKVTQKVRKSFQYMNN